MVVKQRLLFAITTAASMVLAAAMPAAAAAYKDAAPNPLRKEAVVRVHDIEAATATKAHGATVAIGWREGSNEPRLFLTYSDDGGKSYRKGNGNLRKASIAGDPTYGLSLDICDGRIWVGTAADLGAGKVPTDVLLYSREIVGGAAAQTRLTTAAARKVRDVSVSCVGDKLVAIGWLEQVAGKNRAKLMLRSLEKPGLTPSYSRVFSLGEARFKGGLDVAASVSSVHVAWSRGSARDIAYKRFLVGDEKKPSITKFKTRTVASTDAGKPVLAARGSRVVLAYLEAGRVKARVGKNHGASFAPVDVIIGNGSKTKPSKLHSVDVAGSRIVIGASANKKGKYISTRVTSTDVGKTWARRAFGNNGARMGALLKRGGAGPILREAWHHSVSGADDSLRARYEL